MSAPNPASVITYPSSPTSFRAILSATMEEFPCAIFAKGPAWTITRKNSNYEVKMRKRRKSDVIYFLTWRPFQRLHQCWADGIFHEHCQSTRYALKQIKIIVFKHTDNGNKDLTKSSAVMGLSSKSLATTIFPSLCRISFRSVVRARTAMISLATLILNPVTRSCPASVDACPTVICRRNRSFVSRTKNIIN